MNLNDGRSSMESDLIAADASNIRTGGNPVYTLSDFLSMYPGFGKYTTVNNVTTYSGVVPESVLQIYLNLATTFIQAARFHGAWALCVGYCIAHFATLWLQSTADSTSGAAAVIVAGQAKGLLTAEGANDLSASYESIAQDLEGWAAWKLTAHGQNLATLAKLYGKGGMVVR